MPRAPNASVASPPAISVSPPNSADAPASGAPYRQTLNYGGGARWFTTDRIAISVDFRWYSVTEEAAAAGIVAQPKTTLLMLTGGISIK